VLPGTVDIGLLESLARTLIEQVSRPYTDRGHRVTIGASVGIAIGDPGRACADAMVRNADLALYAAKGAAAASIASTSRRCTARRPTARCSKRPAPGDRARRMWVAYQPIVRAAGEEICGFEALVRWNHPVRGPISPDKFIPLAENAA
jgi:predicted signal transduction protein with EAL and GGDEF domain